MQLSQSAKNKMQFLSVKKVHEFAIAPGIEPISLETFYKALQGKEFSSETITLIEQAIIKTIIALYHGEI